MRRSSAPVTDLSKFCNNLEKLFSNLEKAFPQDSDLSYYKDKIMSARKINPRLIVEQFMLMAEDFIDQIMQKNADFFLDDLEVENLVDNSYFDLTNKIKTLWINMSDSSKEMIWRYFQIFITLGVKITKRHDLLPKLNQYRDVPLTI